MMRVAEKGDMEGPKATDTNKHQPPDHHNHHDRAQGTDVS
jgi:hypothetical protein